MSERRRPPVALRLVAAVLPLLLLLGVAELGLWLAGVDGGDAVRSLSRGFDPAARYLEPDGRGGWTTRMFDGDRPEHVIPPRGEQVRVLLFGGSNTQGFPVDVLASELGAAAPDVPWEVVNLGRSGYGSARVAILFEQALAALEPDLVLIYSGHNEFVERGFVEELDAHGASGWERDAVGWVGRLRLFRVLADALARQTLPGAGDGFTQGGDGALPEPFEDLPGAFARQDYARTRRYLDAYRDNLVSMLDLAAARGLPVVLCTLVANHLAAPWGSAPDPALDATDRERLQDIQRELSQVLPRRLVAGLRPALRLTGRSWGQPLPPALRAERLAVPAPNRPRPLRPLSGSLAHAPATEGKLTHSVAGAHWTDPDLWSDEVFALLEVLQRFHARALFPGEADKLVRARALLDEALALDPTHPDSHFAAGLLALLEDRGADAAASLAEAARWDRAPRHANPVINGSVRELAAERGHVTLCDPAAAFASRCPDGVIGFEVMMDHCHLHPGARPALMADLAPAIVAAWRTRGD